MSSVLGLKVTPSTPTVLSRKSQTNRGFDTPAMAIFRSVLTFPTCSSKRERSFGLSRCADYGSYILGEAESPIAWTGMKEFRPDAAIGSRLPSQPLQQ